MCLTLGSSWHYWHHGIDIGIPSGTALYSPVSGRVAENSSGLFGVRALSGQIVYLVHGNTVIGIGLNSPITVGQNVVSSDCVGNCTGPHLHLEVHSSLTFAQSNWDDINPESWLKYQGPHVAAVSWGTNRLDVFLRGTDANVYHKWTADDTNWYPTGSYDALGSAGGGFAG